MRKAAEIFVGQALCTVRVKEGFKVRTSRKKTAVGEGVRRSEGAVRPSAGPGPESADGRASALPGRPKYASDEVNCRRNELQLR